MHFPKFIPVVTGSLISLLCFSCKPQKQEELPKKTVNSIKSEVKWAIPKPAPSGVKVAINEKMELSEVDWLTPGADNQNLITLTILWKTHSPLANLTLKKIQSLEKEIENVNIQLISDKAPRFEIRTNSLNKSYRFGVDVKNEIVERLEIESFPQAYLTTKNRIICWQGHPDNLSGEVIKGIQKKIKSH